MTQKFDDNNLQNVTMRASYKVLDRRNLNIQPRSHEDLAKSSAESKEWER